MTGSVIEQDHPCSITGPEAELLELIRVAHLEDFTLTVEHLAGTFRLHVVDTLQRKYLEGAGLTFEESWRRLRSDPDHHPLNLDEQIAARGLPIDDPSDRRKANSCP